MKYEQKKLGKTRVADNYITYINPAILGINEIIDCIVPMMGTKVGYSLTALVYKLRHVEVNGKPKMQISTPITNCHGRDDPPGKFLHR